MPTYPETVELCGTVSASNPSTMFMNYMDYTDDPGMNMFTQNQKTRMVAALNVSRTSILTSNGCQAPTGIASVSLEEAIRIFPNPSSGTFQITSENATAETISVRIINILGKTISNYSFNANNTNSIDLSSQQIGRAHV